MLDYKATDLQFLKKLFERRGPENREAFLRTLTPAEAELYKKALPVSWVPCEESFAIVGKALPFVYPPDQATMERFGYDLAIEDYGGIYKVLLRIATVEYLIAQIRKFWNTFNRRGVVDGELTPGRKQAVLMVREYPDMCEPYLALLAGYLKRLFEMLGLKNVNSRIDASNRQELKCILTWN